jgi:hypothetical protein
MLRDSCFDDLTTLDDSDWTFANASTMWHLPRLFVPYGTGVAGPDSTGGVQVPTRSPDASTPSAA